MIKNVYAYTRVSTKSQANSDRLGLVRQNTNLKNWLEASGYNLSKLYVETKSGKTAKDRKELQQLLSDIRGQSNVVVYIDSIDRLSRQQPIDALKIINEIRDQGAELFDQETKQTYGANIDISQLIMLILKLQAANDFIGALSYKSKSNYELKYKAIRNGEIVRLNNIPQWVEWSGDRYTVNDMAQHIAHIARMYINGYGYVQLIKYLTDNGVKTLQGGKWLVSTVKGILRNPALYGVLNIKKENIWIEGYYPALISESEYLELQSIIDSKQSKRVYSVKQNHLLNGLCLCGYCGAKMSRKTYNRTRTNGAKYKYVVYVCPHRQSGQCLNNVMHNAEILESSVLDSFDWDRIRSELSGTRVDNSQKRENILNELAVTKSLIQDKAMVGDYDAIGKLANTVKQLEIELNTVEHGDVIVMPEIDLTDTNKMNMFLLASLNNIRVFGDGVRIEFLNGRAGWITFENGRSINLSVEQQQYDSDMKQGLVMDTLVLK